MRLFCPRLVSCLLVGIASLAIARAAPAQCQFGVEYRTLVGSVTFGTDGLLPSNALNALDQAVGEWAQAQANPKPVQRMTVVTDYIHPEGDLRQWAAASDLVVVGTIASSRVEATPRDSKLPPRVTTIYEVVIDDMVRGTGRDGRILVRAPGGRVDVGDKILDVVSPSMPRLEKGQRYVLLLKLDDSAAGKAASVPIYGPLAGGETVFVVSADQHVKTPGQGRLARAFEGKTVAELLTELRGK